MNILQNDVRNLQEVSNEDRKLLHDFTERTAPNSLAYEHSWGYIIQATRYAKLRWYDPANNALIFFGRKSAYDQTLVIPAFFATPQYLHNILPFIQKLLDSPQVILKNIDPLEMPLYLPHDFRGYSEHEYWSEDAKFDDQTYPQLIVNLHTLLQKHGQGYRKLRRYLYAATAKRCTMRPYTERDNTTVRYLLALKDNNSAGRYTTSHEMYPSSATNKYIIEQNSRIIGFTVTSTVSTICTAVCAGIFLPDEPELAPWALYRTMATEYHNGFRFANLGGSETIGTLEFKRQLFQPVRALHRTHLVFDGTKRSSYASFDTGL